MTTIRSFRRRWAHAYHRLMATRRAHAPKIRAKAKEAGIEEAGLAPAPFTSEHGFSPDELAEVRADMKVLGLRDLPYPFSSALSILSDCDGSSLREYEAYVDAFIRLGLDFGDSTWLHWSHSAKFDAATALGFFSYSYSKGRLHDQAWMVRTRTFAQSVAEYHKGNIDHFHSLLRNGPRVVILDSPVTEGDLIEIDTGAFQLGGPWRTDDLHLFGLLVVGECQSAAVIENDGTETADFRRRPAPLEHHTLFVLGFDPEAENRAPLMREVRSVRLVDAHNVRKVVLLSCHSELLLERVARLRDFNVEMNLITAHSQLHFRDPEWAAIKDKVSLERLKNGERRLEGYCGAIWDDTGLIVSTDADDPVSVSRVLPELFDLGLRFIVPRARSSDHGLDPLLVISPTSTRSGGGCYWARRVLPLGVDPYSTSGQESFTVRMRAALRKASHQPSRVWPIYTHLGGLPRERDSRGPPPFPVPYFEETAMRALQNSALGISHHGVRAWLTRGSTLYDYCLMIRAIGKHTTRVGDRIEIKSWRDPILNKILPVSPAQLYGVTFYVDDAAAANVRLDGKIIEAVARNPADSSGRQSVTVLESEIRSILFDQLDPLRNYPDEAQISGRCAWRDGALVVNGAVTIPLHGWRAPAAQAMSFEAEGRFGIRLRTENGGSFYFGNLSASDGYDHASYAFMQGATGCFVVPFHDLHWRAADGEHVPSHPLATITFMGEAKFAKVAFLRPRATTLSRNAFCVAGRVADFEAGQIVSLGERREPVDQRGWFCFPKTPKGIYRLTSGGCCDRRGPLVEVGSDAVDFLIARAIG